MKTETWIYLFFIFLTIIVPLIRGNRKKKAAAPPASKKSAHSSAPPVPDDFLQTLAKELKKAQESMNVNPPIDPPKEYAEEYPDELADYHEIEEIKKPFSYDDQYTGDLKPFEYEDKFEKYEFSSGMNEKLSEPKRADQLPSEEDAYSDHEDSHEMDFNPIKAVIYSEIMKRPEF